MLAAVNPQPPTLSAWRQERLASAADDADFREDAFLALIEDARAWPAPTEPSACQPSLPRELLREPGTFRGRMYEVLGRLEQVERLPAPYEDVFESFVRPAGGAPLVVYVIRQRESVLVEGANVRLCARFYKRVRFISRDGKDRAYAAFVGAWPQRAPTTARAAAAARSGGLNGLWPLAVLVPTMLFVYLALSTWLRRARRTRAIQPTSPSPWRDAAPVDQPATLPDDPAAALAELKRRADATR